MWRADHHHPLQVCIMGKSLHPITNWHQYNRSLIDRGSLTFWVDADALDNWFHQDHYGRRGRSQRYTDQTICTFLMLKGILSLTLRATQRLLDALFALMNVPLCAPDYPCVSKAGPHGEGGLSAALQGAHHRSGYRFNWSKGVWRRRVASKKTRR